MNHTLPSPPHQHHHYYPIDTHHTLIFPFVVLNLHAYFEFSFSFWLFTFWYLLFLYFLGKLLFDLFEFRLWCLYLYFFIVTSFSLFFVIFLDFMIFLIFSNLYAHFILSSYITFLFIPTLAYFPCLSSPSLHVLPPSITPSFSFPCLATLKLLMPSWRSYVLVD